MHTIFSERHSLRDPRVELEGGQLVPPREVPARIETIRRRIEEVGLGDILVAREYGLGPVLRVHSSDYLEFLATAFDAWQAAGYHGDAIASTWPARRMVGRPPRDIEGRLGYYAFAAETAIDAGTWDAAVAAADTALTAAERILSGERAVFALCRPPGHHAARDLYGGYCFLSNAAIAAQFLIDHGAGRIAILDVDFHHGNGTQDIFYERSDVFFASLHGDPRDAFPYFSGFADETGAGEGEGFNLNIPLPPGTDFRAYAGALDHALARIRDFGPDVLVVSLGVDTYEGDPLGFFGIESHEFSSLGGRIARLRRPTLFVMEGGYALDELGLNVVNVLTGFEDA